MRAVRRLAAAAATAGLAAGGLFLVAPAAHATVRNCELQAAGWGPVTPEITAARQKGAAGDWHRCYLELTALHVPQVRADDACMEAQKL